MGHAFLLGEDVDVGGGEELDEAVVGLGVEELDITVRLSRGLEARAGGAGAADDEADAGVVLEEGCYLEELLHTLLLAEIAGVEDAGCRSASGPARRAWRWRRPA